MTLKLRHFRSALKRKASTKRYSFVFASYRILPKTIFYLYFLKLTAFDIAIEKEREREAIAFVRKRSKCRAKPSELHVHQKRLEIQRRDFAISSLSFSLGALHKCKHA